jgi:acetylornithine deacetylase/succinyl-diaminopimelate desuccinylase-like protein
MPLDLANANAHIKQTWEADLVPQLVDYVRLPALSPNFDPEWERNGHIAAAVEQITSWIAGRQVAGMRMEVQELPGRTPLIVVEIDAFGSPATDATVVLYGHLDKQPEMTGWREGLGPWTPVISDGKLYGRGGADDGYAAFASLTAIEAVQRCGGSHARCVLLVEASEESGSPDLPAHIDALAERLGEVDLVLCLDSGCATYDTMWLTTSLRGLVIGRLSVSIVTEGLHSGAVGGVVPSTFRIVRSLLDRIEDSATGEVLLDSAKVDIPDFRVKEAEAVAAELGLAALESPPLVDGARLAVDSAVEGLLSKTWYASLSVTGADGLPPTAKAGNVLRPNTTLTLSLRVPPTADSAAVLDELTTALTADPPYGAHVTFEAEHADGWHAPDLQPWLADVLDDASSEAFGRGMRLYGEGGTIPFMGMLGEKFPAAQFVITGVLGPESNAHGPNEFLHLDYAERLTNCLSAVLDGHARRSGAGR